ncbi:MAG: hypothetical protein U5L45_10950, partial [Saprospiraceae bacterium]|nr:hypothetical protein [Saprospiraceae bacterium]
TRFAGIVANYTFASCLHFAFSRRPSSLTASFRHSAQLDASLPRGRVAVFFFFAHGIVRQQAT